MVMSIVKRRVSMTVRMKAPMMVYSKGDCPNILKLSVVSCFAVRWCPFYVSQEVF